MTKSAASRKLSHGEILAQRLAHDRNLMASIDKAMQDVEENRVMTVEEFAKALKSERDVSSNRLVAG